MFLRKLRNERGGVLVLSAVMIPAFLLLTALVVDAGTWFTHKRQLQNRADAGALAAGVEYATRWAACAEPTQKAAVEAAIDTAARRYAGDPQQAGAVFNSDVVTEQARVNVEINSNSTNVDENTSWNDTGIGGIGPCDPHPAADAFSPADSYWVDVKVKERNQQTLFGAFGLNLLRNRAQARVELKTVAAGEGFLPIALPDQDIRQAQIRYYRYCGTPNPDFLATVPLRPLGSDYQTVSGTTLWGPTLNNTTGGTPVGVDLPIPADKTCSPGPNSIYMPVRAEVRVAGVESTVVNIDNFTCSQLAAMRYTDCWEQVSGFSVDGDNPKTQPWFHEVTLTGGSGSGQCSFDAYFAKPPVGETSCSYGVSVRVDWNDLTNNPPAGRELTVSVGGALTPPGAGVFNGVWTGSSTNSSLGQGLVNLTWTCTEPDTSSQNPNDRKNCPGTNGGGTVPVHSVFLADRANAGLLTLVRTSLNGQQPNQQPGAELHWYPAPQTANPTITVYPTVGLEGSLYVGQRRVLRAPKCKNNTNSDNCDIDTSSPNSSQSIDCEPTTGGQGHDFVMFADGCRPWYGFNLFDDPTWWPCPDKGGLIAEPNSRGTPWLCVVKAPGFSPPVIADGIAAAIGNCSNRQANSCQKYTCTNPNYYDPSNPGEWALQGGKPSPRVVFLFVVPYGAYKNTGPQETLPVINFAAFYVTGWEGKGQGNSNPCDNDPDGPNGPGLADDPLTTGGDIVGYFVNYTVPNAPGDPNSVCDIEELRPCTPVLVR